MRAAAFHVPKFPVFTFQLTPLKGFQTFDFNLWERYLGKAVNVDAASDPVVVFRSLPTDVGFDTLIGSFNVLGFTQVIAVLVLSVENAGTAQNYPAGKTTAGASLVFRDAVTGLATNPKGFSSPGLFVEIGEDEYLFSGPTSFSPFLWSSSVPIPVAAWQSGVPTTVRIRPAY